VASLLGIDLTIKQFLFATLVVIMLDILLLSVEFSLQIS